MYGESTTVCTPYRVCNICEERFDSCGHEEGTIYDGTTCAPFTKTICNICGRNFDSCEHKKGIYYDIFYEDDDEITQHIDITTLKNSIPGVNVIATGLDKLGIDTDKVFRNLLSMIVTLGLDDLSGQDLLDFAIGIGDSVYENVLFIQPFSPMDDNHYYMLGKVTGDAAFYSSFLTISGVSGSAAVASLEAAIDSGALALATSETGVGFAVFGTASGASVVSSLSCGLVCCASSAMLGHTGEVLSKDSAKYANTEIPVTIKGSKLKRALAKHPEIQKIPEDYSYATHHIVAANDRRANKARTILNDFGIDDFNIAENGVFLPIEDGLGAMNHRRLHTETYYRTVEQYLGKAESREDVFNILAKIRQELLDGTFPR